MFTLRTLIATLLLTVAVASQVQAFGQNLCSRYDRGEITLRDPSVCQR